MPGSEGLVPLTGYLDLNNRSPWSPGGRWLLVRPATLYPYLVDTEQLAEPQPLDVGEVHGWLDDVSYLASVAQGSATELYRCLPPKTCHLLGRVEGQVRDLSYVPQFCSSQLEGLP